MLWFKTHSNTAETIAQSQRAMIEFLAVIDEEPALSVPDLNRYLRGNGLLGHNMNWQEFKPEQFGLDTPKLDAIITEPPSVFCPCVCRSSPSCTGSSA